MKTLLILSILYSFGSTSCKKNVEDKTSTRHRPKLNFVNYDEESEEMIVGVTYEGCSKGNVDISCSKIDPSTCHWPIKSRETCTNTITHEQKVSIHLDDEQSHQLLESDIPFTINSIKLDQASSVLTFEISMEECSHSGYPEKDFSCTQSFPPTCSWHLNKDQANCSRVEVSREIQVQVKTIKDKIVIGSISINIAPTPTQETSHYTPSTDEN